MKTSILLVSIFLAFLSVTIAPTTQAACQEGCDISNANTFLGDEALVNASGASNTAIGADALGVDTTGSANTAVGSFALLSNTTGMFNTATGAGAMEDNTTGVGNTATGALALFNNTTGKNNMASGFNALFNNTTGISNTAIGAFALISNTTGNGNTALGQNALGNSTTGINNTALGKQAGFNLTTGDNNIDIGNTGFAADANTIRIGTNGTHTNTVIAGISGVTVADGVGVIIDARGRLGTVVSSARFKDNIQPMDKASEAILALRPVIFHYKPDLDSERIPQFGLVAEEVEKVNPDLVARDDKGRAYSVRYEAVNSMLLNEFLKEHRKGEEQDRKIQEQAATIAELGSEMKALTAIVNEQASQLQKVSAQLQINNPSAPSIAENP